MTPIERISEKAQCLSALGLSSTANLSDVRRAYKELILEKHPDSGSGTTDELSEITNAYRFLKANADELGLEMPAPTARASTVRPRPALKPQETVFSNDVVKECREHLSKDEARAHHVAAMLHRTGRSLTYIVPTPAKDGLNEVVVATGELVDSRRAVPQVVTLHNAELTRGAYHVPEDLCEKLFPGARAVKIRFAS